MSEKSTRATSAKTTPGPANRVARSPPSKANAVSSTPIVATAAPSACSGFSDSPRRTTDRTTVRPPNAATMPLTTAIGPNWSPVKYDR